MTRLKNVSGSDLVLYAVTGEAGSFAVADGEYVEVPGEIANSDDEAADFHLIGDGDAARAWPKSSWQVADSDARTPRTRSGGGTKTNGEE